MRSIFGRIAAMAETHNSARVLAASGWKGRKSKSRIVGYHRCLPLADLKALAYRLQREARS